MRFKKCPLFKVTEIGGAIIPTMVFLVTVGKP